MLTMEASISAMTGGTILRGLNLRIDMDDRIALLGANGNGKSTFAKLLAGRLETPMARQLAANPASSGSGTSRSTRPTSW